MYPQPSVSPTSADCAPRREQLYRGCPCPPFKLASTGPQRAATWRNSAGYMRITPQCYSRSPQSSPLYTEVTSARPRLTTGDDRFSSHSRGSLAPQHRWSTMCTRFSGSLEIDTLRGNCVRARFPPSSCTRSALALWSFCAQSAPRALCAESTGCAHCCAMPLEKE